jgi:GlcNAc-P-P-Und epimerase
MEAASVQDDHTAIVIGGSGFIGRHLVSDLDRDITVAKIVILDKDPPATLSEKTQFVSCDLRQPLDWKPSSPREQLRCYHLAGICREPGYSWDEYFSGNYLIARNVADWATRIELESIIFTSTSMVFRASDRRHAESDLPNADTAYGISKALSEERLHSWAAANPGRRLYVLRPGVVFGKGGGGNFVRLQRALRRNLFCYVGRNTTVKSVIYVKDLVRVLRACASSELRPGTYHALYHEPLTLKQICRAFCEVYGWHRYVPTLPYKAMLLLAMPFEIANALGMKNSIHRRRIEKLHQSMDLSAENLKNQGLELKYPIADAISDWRADCLPEELY